MSDASEKVYRIPLLKFTPLGKNGLLVAYTPVGEFQIQPRAEDRVWAMIHGGPEKRVSSIDEAKEVAQAWYVERMAQGLEEVPQSLTDEQCERLKKALREDAGERKDGA